MPSQQQTEAEAQAEQARTKNMSTPNDKLLKAARLVEAHSHANADGSYTVDESAMNAICRAIKQPRKAPQPQPPQGERVKNTSFAWLPYLHKAKLVSTDAQLSGDFRVIARLMQQIDALQAQRGELIAALRDIREVSANPCSVAGVVMESIGLQQFASRVFSVARAAIARATQGGQS